MVLLINRSIKNGITILPRDSSELFWIRLSKTYFGFKNDVFRCFAYIAPVLRHNLDILRLLENNIAKYSKLGSILIMGDTNDRTGTTHDFIDNDDKYIPIPHDICGGSFCFMSWCLKYFCAVGALCMFAYF